MDESQCRSANISFTRNGDKPQLLNSVTKNALPSSSAPTSKHQSAVVADEYGVTGEKEEDGQLKTQVKQAFGFLYDKL